MGFKKQYVAKRKLEKKKASAPGVRSTVRAANEIADRHTKKFARAFREALREVLPEKPSDDFRAAWEARDISAACAAVGGGNVESLANFLARIEAAYKSVVRAGGQAATEKLNSTFKTKLAFGLDDGKSSVEVMKKKGDKKWLPTVPINPYSLDWIRARGLDLAKNLSTQQTQVIGQMIEHNFAGGLRASEIYEQVRANIGLLPRDYDALLRREALMEEQGYQSEDIADALDKYRNEKLDMRSETIARTETIAAQNRGREDAWKVAQDSGSLPAGVIREWYAAPSSGNPNSPCEDCLEMHGKTATIDGDFDGPDGPVHGPPLHPRCECTEILRRE